MKVRVLEAGVELIEQPFAKVLQLSSGLISEATEARVHVRVEAEGKQAIGRGSIYLGELWSWPDFSLTRVERDAALRALTQAIAGKLPEWCGEPAHPLELGLRLHHRACEAPGPPVLAQAMCASPFDAAIHDGAGQALGRSAFSFYDEDGPIPSADALFARGGAMRAVRGILREPVEEMDAWWVVSAKDDLANEVEPYVREQGFRCFKLKILGKDAAADAARTAEVYRALRAYGVEEPVLSVDSNEANPDAGSVLEYLERLESIEPRAYAALLYLEQPTHRDIRRHAHDWRKVRERKPVFLDEGLTGFDVLPLAQEQGWSGLALKTCKGHSFTLVAAAWALEKGLLLSLQDLGNPGYAAIHSFAVAAHLPTINGVEINSPQYTPAANAPWLPRLAGLLEPRGGKHRLGMRELRGLGSNL
jgi:L-alanine-DL-glutamate epimerase-like enolase superfamily enzyme